MMKDSSDLKCFQVIKRVAGFLDKSITAEEVFKFYLFNDFAQSTKLYNPKEYVSEQKPGVNKSVEDGKMPTKKVKVDLAHRCTIFLCHLGCEMINTNIQ